MGEKKINIDAVWHELLSASAEMYSDNSRSSAEKYLKSCVPISIEDGVLAIDVPTGFTRDRINDSRGPLEEFLRSMEYAESIDLRTTQPISPKAAEDKARIAAQQAEPVSNGLNPNYLFDNFVVGKSNRLSHAASLAVAESPGTAYNPLFIWGGVGLGKTHLMHAIAHHIMQNYPGSNILYVSAEKFTNDYISSVRLGSFEEFRKRYRNLDVLLIDDIQFFGGKSETQESFFHTFNSLHEVKKQIIISSDKPPKELGALEERLVSRFEWGLVTDIQQPDLETRIAILQAKAELKNIDIGDDIILFLAQHIPSNIRELEGALNRVSMHSSISSDPMTIENVADWLKDILRNTSKGNLSIAQIQQLVAESAGVTIDDLTSAKRTAELVMARQIAMYVSREKLRESLQQIGVAFNKRDHTTVLHACKKVEALLKNDIRVKMIVDNVMNKL